MMKLGREFQDFIICRSESQKMKIAITSDTLLTGGAERQMLLTAAELTRAGHTVKIVIYYPSCVEFDEFIQQNDIDLVAIEAKGFMRIGRILAISKFLRREKFDIVHGFKGGSTIITALAAKLAGIRNVFGGFRSICTETGKFRFALKFVNRLLIGWIVNSRAIADSMVSNLSIKPEKLAIFYNGIYPDAFRSKLSKEEARKKLGLSKDCKTITMVARLAKVKNHKMLLETARILTKKIPELKVLIAGDGPLANELKALAETYGITDQVLFLGNRSDIPDILAATDVAVLTSSSEGFPNALIEPMSVGIPVVSTDYPAIHELVVDGQHGYIVPRNDADAMAESITKLLQDDETRKKMGLEGLKLVHKSFSPQNMARQLVAVYEGKLNFNGKLLRKGIQDAQK